MDPVGHHGRVVRLADVVEQDGELVAALAGEGIALAQARLEPGGHLHEQIVAGRVPEAVVDGLESIEIEEENGEPVSLAPSRTRERALDQIEEQRPVGQARERVVQRIVEHAVGDRLALRDVHERARDPNHFGRPILHDAATSEHPLPRAVAIQEPVLVFEPIGAALDMGGKRSVELLAIRRMDPLQPRRGVFRKLRHARDRAPGRRSHGVGP